MSGTDHPCQGMTKAQIAAFEQVAIGGKPPATKATWVALEGRGVVVRGPDLVRRDALPVLRQRGISHRSWRANMAGCEGIFCTAILPSISQRESARG